MLYKSTTLGLHLSSVQFICPKCQCRQCNVSVNTLRHAIDSVQLVLPENYPELIDLKETLLYRIEKLLKSKGNTIPPKTKQNLNKERSELSNKCTHGKLIAHGIHRVDRRSH